MEYPVDTREDYFEDAGAGAQFEWNLEEFTNFPKIIIIQDPATLMLGLCGLRGMSAFNHCSLGQ